MSKDWREFIFTRGGFGVKRVSRDAIKKNLKTLLHIANQAKVYGNKKLYDWYCLNKQGNDNE